jgi:periplasmic protein TonB
MPSRLVTAFALSLAVHGALLLPDFLKRLAATPRPPALQATLRLPPAPSPAEALLKNTLDAEAPPPRREPPPPPKADLAIPAPASKAAPKPPPKRELQAAQRKLSQHLFYPAEAVARGLEGEVRLILKLSPGGAIDDVLVAASSGHAVLDNAAIRAAYAMGEISGVSGRELILPVIFRLQ